MAAASFGLSARPSTTPKKFFGAPAELGEAPSAVATTATAIVIAWRISMAVPLDPDRGRIGPCRLGLLREPSVRVKSRLSMSIGVQQSGGGTEVAAAGRIRAAVSPAEPEQAADVPALAVVHDKPEGAIQHAFLPFQPPVQVRLAPLSGAPAELRHPQRRAPVVIPLLRPAKSLDRGSQLGDAVRVGVEGRRVEVALDPAHVVHAIQKVPRRVVLARLEPGKDDPRVPVDPGDRVVRGLHEARVSLGRRFPPPVVPEVRLVPDLPRPDRLGFCGAGALHVEDAVSDFAARPVAPAGPVALDRGFEEPLPAGPLPPAARRR